MAFGGLEIDPFAYTVPGSLVPFTDTAGRTSTSPTLDPEERTFIAIIEGQSLAASHIPHAYTVTNVAKVQCVNWAGDRLLYQHKEPMFGGTFHPAGHIPGNNWDLPYISLWGLVGDMLIDGDVFDRIIWCNVSAGGMQASVLAPGGALGQRLPVAFHVLRSLGISGNHVSAILSMIGESDNNANTPEATYLAHRRATSRVSRSYGFTGPWFVPLESYTAGDPPSSEIRAAQAILAAHAGNIAGPDFDALGSSYRDFNGTHQNALGHDTMAQMWFDVRGLLRVTMASAFQRNQYFIRQRGGGGRSVELHPLAGELRSLAL
jgi:hypothetical protein